MSITEIRQQLHDYIDNAEDKKLKALYVLLENDIAKRNQPVEVQSEELD